MRSSALMLFAAACSLAQQPQVENAKLETRAFAGTIASQISQSGAGPFWIAWSEPIIPGRRGEMCWSNGNNDTEHSAGAPVRLEGQVALVVLARIENSQVDQLRVVSPDCRLDAGGLPLVWLNNVPAQESVNWLKAQISGKHPDTAIFSIGLHSGADADQALDELSSPSQPERVREKTAFWLGTSRGVHGVEMLKRMLAAEPSQKVREQVVFALAQSREPAGMAAVIDAAKSDRDSKVRAKALFWLAQKAAGKQAQDVIGNAVVNDPDRSVKEQAVFALKQLPEDQGVPLLINVAKTNPDPAVRKKAIFWLGQSKDPRALDYFAQILKP